MARTRSLRPGFFSNLDLGDVPIEARYMWSGMWCMSDRDGIMEDRPKKIKAFVFPYDDITTDQVENWLVILEHSGFIIRYTHSGARLIAHRNWNRHQKPYIREQESIWAVPEQCQGSAIAPTIAPQPAVSSSKSQESKSQDSKKSDYSYRNTFRVWIEKYPKKDHVANAEKAWNSIVTSMEICRQVLEGTEYWVRRWKREKTGRKYVPLPATFLTREDWKDVQHASSEPTRKQVSIDCPTCGGSGKGCEACTGIGKIVVWKEIK